MAMHFVMEAILRRHKRTTVVTKQAVVFFKGLIGGTVGAIFLSLQSLSHYGPVVREIGPASEAQFVPIWDQSHCI